MFKHLEMENLGFIPRIDSQLQTMVYFFVVRLIVAFICKKVLNPVLFCRIFNILIVPKSCVDLLRLGCCPQVNLNRMLIAYTIINGQANLLYFKTLYFTHILLI